MDGIIFDVDGTLWDSTEVVAKSWNQAVKENSNLVINITRADLLSLFGKTMDAITEALFPTLSYEERTKLGYLCFDYENELLSKEYGTLFPGVREVFETLSRTYNLYIVSNCQCGYIEAFLDTMQLGCYIKDHLCFGETKVEKNETIRLLMDRNNLEDVIYVGDTQGDFDACQKADVPFIFAEYGFGNAPDAKIRIKSISELPELVHVLDN